MATLMPAAGEILGVPVGSFTLTGLIAQAMALSRAGKSATLLYANIHVLNRAYHDAALRAILNRADIIYCDGAGVKLGARLLGRPLPERMTGADWIEPLCAACAQQQVRIFFLGSRPGVAARAAEVLLARHPGLPVVGSHHGYLADPAVSAAAVAAVNAAAPQILLVGMGTPLQERWIAAQRKNLSVPVVWAVGALFDFVAGTQPRGPRWMLDHGLEWLYRLGSDPQRLWRRYLVGNPLFFWRVLKQRWGWEKLKT